MAEITIQSQEGRYFTTRDLREGLAKFRGKQVPRSTLHDWLKILAIEPDETGCYSPETFTLLARYAVWLQRGGLSKGFITLNNIQQKETTHDNRQQHQQQWQRFCPQDSDGSYTISI
jgi:hypothetical protein